jgi:hypothetical protein
MTSGEAERDISHATLNMFDSRKFSQFSLSVAIAIGDSQNMQFSVDASRKLTGKLRGLEGMLGSVGRNKDAFHSVRLTLQGISSGGS